MTTILEALEQLAGGGSDQTPRRDVSGGPGRGRRWKRAAALSLVLGTAAVGIIFSIAGREVSTPSSISAPGSAAPRLDRIAKQSAREAASERPLVDEPPWARIETRERSVEAPLAHRKAQRDETEQDPALADSLPAAGISTPGGRRLQVHSIVHSRDPLARAVNLEIDGRVMTLREGDSVDGVEVQLILGDRVYVREGATVFAVHGGS